MDNELICGCVVEGDDIPCVFDDPDFTASDCNYAVKLRDAGKGRDDCEYWKPVDADADNGNEISRLTSELTAAKEEIRDVKRRLAIAETTLKAGPDGLWELADYRADNLSLTEGLRESAKARRAAESSLASERKVTERLRELVAAEKHAADCWTVKHTASPDAPCTCFKARLKAALHPPQQEEQ